MMPVSSIEINQYPVKFMKTCMIHFRALIILDIRIVEGKILIEPEHDEEWQDHPEITGRHEAGKIKRKEESGQSIKGATLQETEKNIIQAFETSFKP